MANLGLILLVFAFVFACIASRWRSIPPWDFLSLAIAFWILSEIVSGAVRSGILPH
jgi:hypothetical protein